MNVNIGTLNKTHGQSNTPEYRAWKRARSRCNNPNDRAFPQYGGRGIQFCFETFEQFVAEIGLRPSNAHSLDRIDVNGGYQPGNIRWATRTEQNRNKRTNTLLTFQGKTKCLAEWAESTNINLTTLIQRFRYGWSVEKTLTTPVR